MTAPSASLPPLAASNATDGLCNDILHASPTNGEIVLFAPKPGTKEEDEISYCAIYPAGRSQDRPKRRVRVLHAKTRPGRSRSTGVGSRYRWSDVLIVKAARVQPYSVPTSDAMRELLCWPKRGYDLCPIIERALSSHSVCSYRAINGSLRNTLARTTIKTLESECQRLCT